MSSVTHDSENFPDASVDKLFMVSNKVNDRGHVNCLARHKMNQKFLIALGAKNGGGDHPLV